MTRVSFADRGWLFWLSLRRNLGRTLGRARAHRLFRLPFLTRRSERLLIAPQDLRTADPTRASEIYGGRFAFAGKIVACGGCSPFQISPPSEEWAEALLSFGWLRDLRAADSAITRANARALVDEWIALQGSWNHFAWQPEILSRRIIAWLSHAPLILNDVDIGFYRRFLRTLARQVRCLRSTAGHTRDGVPRLQARIALVYAALCMGGQERHLRKAARALVAELERQVLPDGGHISRNPGALIELLLDLLPLGQLFTARNLAPPTALISAVDRMIPMLRFFRHGDGKLALFNGMGPTHPDLIATVLAYDDIHGTAPPNARHSGYQRIEAGHSALIVDTGCPPPLMMSGEAHAGCLSFELSAKHRIVVNCGMPEVGKPSWQAVARATAAHSTVTFNDTSSCSFAKPSSFKCLVGSPIVAGPTKVSVTRTDRENGCTLRSSHNGYAKRFNVIHQRTLALTHHGTRLDGEELFHSETGEISSFDHFVLRFHLHPAVRAERAPDGHRVVLTLPNREVWHFSADADRVQLEDSVYLAGQDGARRTLQIVICGRARHTPRVVWSFSHAPQSQQKAAATAASGSATA